MGSTFRAVSDREACAVLAAAVEVGVNLVDVAPLYGDGLAERRLGAALARVDRDALIVATKVGRYGPRAADCDYRPERVRRSVEESLVRLRLDHLDLVQVHDVEFGDLRRIGEETLPAFADLRAAGTVRWIGVTGLSLRALELLAGAPQVDTVLSYCRLTLNDQALEERLPAFARRGVGVLNAAPLGMGLLSARAVPAWHPAPAEVKRCCRLAVEHCARRGSAIERLAVQFACSRPGVATTVVGTASAEHLRDLAAGLREPLDEELLGEVLAILEPVRNVSWSTGRPENA
jgi:L-galactose dehydrogenase